MRLLVLLIAGATLALSAEDSSDVDGEQSRKILGSSVVTSVSVIMDTGNGSKTVFTDAVGKPVPKPSSASEVASPIELLNPDRYEFYTFDDNGDLIKRLMSLEEIQGIIATGDSDGYDLDSFTSLGYLPEKRVNDVVNNVQNVLKEEIETHKTPPDPKPVFDTPDVSDSWSMILPAVFGNSGEDIKPERPIAHVTPDTIMVEPNAPNVYLSTSSQKDSNTRTTSSSFFTSASTPRSTSYSEVYSPSVSSTSAQMSTTDKLTTINTGSTTNKIPVLTPVTEAEIKPVINVEIYSNSKSTTEKPLDQLGVENVHTVEIRPNTTEVPKISSESVTTTTKPVTTEKIQASSQYSTQTDIKLTSSTTGATKELPTLPPFTPSSIGSTLPTTKYSTKLSTEQTLGSTAATTTDVPILTRYTTEGHISTWKDDPVSVAATETQTVTEEVPISTWIPKLTTTSVASTTTATTSASTTTTTTTTTTTEKVQPPSELEILPTLAELLNLNQNVEIKPSEQITTTVTPKAEDNFATTVLPVDGNKDKEEFTTTEYTVQKLQSTERYVPEDLSTLGSEFLPTKLEEFPTLQNENQFESTTHFELSTSNDQKVSATELLDQLLYTTNIYEINTELGEKTTEQQTFSNEDERFETNTQEESKVSEVKTEPPTTTEQFLIEVTEPDEDPTTDRTLINSIEQLLSQAVGNVENVITALNDTQTIQDMLDNSGNKNMSSVQVESATLASNLIDSNSNFQDKREQTTTEMSMLDAITSGESSVLSDSVGSLLSQVYESNIPTATSNVEILSTEKYSAPTTLPSVNTDNDIIFTTSPTNKVEAAVNISEHLSSNDTVSVPEITTTENEEITNESTTVAYIPINTINSTVNSSKDDDFIPHLINITIISTENANNNIRNASYKPAKSDVSLEQMLDEELKKNLTLAESIETYAEQTLTSNETSSDKLSNEILKAEETMAASFNSDFTTTKEPATETTTTDVLELQETTEFSLEESTFATTEAFVPVKDTPVVGKRPTTVVIIRKTEKPSTASVSTAVPDKSDEDIDTTTDALDEKLVESTTYSKLERTPFVTERLQPSTTEYVRIDINTEEIIKNTTKEESSLETTIDNKYVFQNPVNLTLTANATQFNKNISEIKEHKPQELSNTKIPIQSLKKEDANTPIKQKPSEIISENKPESTWTLVPTIAPHGDGNVNKNEPSPLDQYPEVIDPPAPVDLEAKPLQGFGLEDSTSRLDSDIYQFAQLCNELAFGFWKTVTNGLSSARSVFVSPFGATSLLAMVFLGARGATSGEMNEILRLDDMVTFNPHLIFKNVSESIKPDELDSGVASSAVIRELFSDRSKGKLLPFYKERAKAFYDGYVEEVSFREIGDVIRRRTNLQVKKYTNGRTGEYLKDSSINARSPLAGVSVNIFQTDCSHASTEGRDGELHFVVLPSIRQRRLIPVPAVVYRSGFLAGYEPSLDATAISLGTKDQTVSTIMVIPGQQGVSAPGDGLARLEKRLVESSFKKGAWSRLLRSLIPRPGLEVQIPRFSHKSVINATVALKRMGLHDLFDVEKADLRGLNGVANELFLSDMLQINSFATCGEKRIGDTHHSEIYPATAFRARNSRYLEHFESEESFWRSDLLEEPRDYQRAFHDPLHDPSFLSLPLPLRPRQARVPESPRLRFDRPFIYFVRHNPTGLILHMGRFNPRLLP